MLVFCIGVYYLWKRVVYNLFYYRKVLVKEVVGIVVNIVFFKDSLYFWGYFVVVFCW